MLDLLSDGCGVYLAASLPYGLQQGQAVLVLTAEEYSHRVLGKALRLRQVPVLWRHTMLMMSMRRDVTRGGSGREGTLVREHSTLLLNMQPAAANQKSPLTSGPLA